MQHHADTRPAWLWSNDGETLLWSNAAAVFFLAKIKKSGIKLAQPAVPIKGQISRIARLGSIGRSSLSRVQLLAGDKPTSSTCACTPLEWDNGKIAVLIVDVDPIDPEILARNAADQAILAHADEAIEGDAPSADPIGQIITTEQQAADLGNWNAEADVDRHDEPSGESLPDNARADGADHDRVAAVEDPAQPLAVVDVAETEVETFAPIDETTAEPLAQHAHGDRVDSEPRLSGLMARMVDNGNLYAPLTDDDDLLLSSEGPEADETTPEPAPTLFKVTGRGFINDQTLTPIATSAADDDFEDLQRLDDMSAAPDQADGTDNPSTDLREQDGELLPEAVETPADEPVAPVVALENAPDVETVERVSRYNFDELSRILNDRVGETAPQHSAAAFTDTQATGLTASGSTGALINLGGETLVLNRLPLGILVFRDQQVLFANRAITEMTGHDSVAQLRLAGLAAIFPSAGPDGHEAGPINHIVQRDGSLVPVTARLQSISWQGRPALMLSASATEVRTGHEGAVRAFAEALAEARADGFFETNRSGAISSVNGRAAGLFAATAADLIGRPLSGLVAGVDLPEFRSFLERPARFAETARPCLTVAGQKAGLQLLVFAQGQAGVLSGYFGFVHRDETHRLPAQTGNGEPEPALLARISRGVRRPLNTIIGFSDLIRSEAFGALNNDRYETYAQDIRTAGQEIAALVDELDDYARLKDGRYMPQRASIELGALLETCVVRVRQQAGSARVIVRSAISEKLPRITADRASLSQAVLNLLASAIDQTPAGGAVVISAQTEDNGAIAIHVRDSSNAAVDMAERFVVFRDGIGRDGETLSPVRSSVGLALTRSLLAVNAFSLKIDPAGEQGMLFSLLIPADLLD